MALNVVSSWFYFISHKECECVTCTLIIVYGHLQQPSVLRSHGCLPELFRVHLTQTFIALDIGTFLSRTLNFCKECKQVDDNPDPKALAMAGLTDDQIRDKELYKPGGCSHCNETGYRGRKGIFEMLEINSELRELAFNRASVTEIRRAAKASGMTTLLEDGHKKILKGMTSVEEIVRITQAEMEAEG